MNRFILLLMTLLLFSCGGVNVNIEDLSEFVNKAKSQVYPINDNVPVLKKIDPIFFTKMKGRDPFSEPQAEVVAPVKNAPKSCPQPNFERKKQPLEMFSLDNMSMQGTVLINDVLWALVKVSGGDLYKVKPGYYLGLSYGKVLKITNNEIELLELASDQDGCWQERVTQMKLHNQ